MQPFSLWPIFFWHRLSLCNPECPGITLVDQSGFQFRDPHASASQVLDYRCAPPCPACNTFLTDDIFSFFYYVYPFAFVPAEVRRQLVGAGSLLLPCGSWGLTSDTLLNLSGTFRCSLFFNMEMCERCSCSSDTWQMVWQPLTAGSTPVSADQILLGAPLEGTNSCWWQDCFPAVSPVPVRMWEDTVRLLGCPQLLLAST